MSKARELLGQLREFAPIDEKHLKHHHAKLVQGYYHLYNNAQIDGPFQSFQDAHSLLPPFLARVVHCDGNGSFSHCDSQGNTTTAAGTAIVGEIGAVTAAANGE